MSTVDTTVHITLPESLYDYIMVVKLKRPLTESEMGNYTKIYTSFVKEGKCRDWFREGSSHFIRLYQNHSHEFPDQILIYYGSGIKFVDTPVSNSFFESREFKLKCAESIDIMGDRVYAFARRHGLPIQTIVKKTNGQIFMSPCVSQLQRVSPIVFDPHTKRHTCHHHRIPNTLQEKSFVLGDSYIARLTPPVLEKRFHTVPLFQNDTENKRDMENRGYRSEFFYSIN